MTTCEIILIIGDLLLHVSESVSSSDFLGDGDTYQSIIITSAYYKNKNKTKNCKSSTMQIFLLLTNSSLLLWSGVDRIYSSKLPSEA